MNYFYIFIVDVQNTPEAAMKQQICKTPSNCCAIIEVDDDSISVFCKLKASIDF